MSHDIGAEDYGIARLVENIWRDGLAPTCFGIPRAEWLAYASKLDAMAQEGSMHDVDKHRPTKRVLAMRRAAVAFANNYGPLAAANTGNEEAQHEVAARLHHACTRVGLKIILEPEPN